MDINQIFFDETDELLADMEQHLLSLDPQAPDTEQLNAIFRAAHSIKGGAATFGFTMLQETTHLLENLLDGARRQEIHLDTGMINRFLETKDIMQAQLDAYKVSQQPSDESFEYICGVLRQLAIKSLEKKPPENQTLASATRERRMRLSGLQPEKIPSMLAEVRNFGEIKDLSQGNDSVEFTLITTVSEEDISLVLCFELEPEQISFIKGSPLSTEAAMENHVTQATMQATTSPLPTTKTVKKAEALNVPPSPKPPPPHAKAIESTSIRVAVDKVDQLINLVGELVITQSMLTQRASMLDPVVHGDLLSSMGQLERNARDLQESVMSTRMMPMEYVFSRFPRLVWDLASKLNKQVKLTLQGSSTELDKSLIEHMINPLTHLVRNSLDHGIEDPAARLAAGKPAVGSLTLSAEHQGGNICIEVTDDGIGLDRKKILAKAASQGIPVNDHMSDQEISMLIFTPGFSTAEQVSDISGRGVGMDVVKRNIQDLGGQFSMNFQAGKGTSIRILLPLTLAILEGMSVKVNNEVFVLPLNAVIESLQPKAEDLYLLAGGEERMLKVRDEYLPLLELYRIFDITNAKTEATQGIAVILQSAGRRYALLVDQLLGQHQVVVKNLESNYRKVPGISAATILSDGSVSLIIDVSTLQILNREKQMADAAP